MSYCVYKHTFPNGKVYIGITCQKPEKRWRSGWGYLNKKNGEYTQPLIAKAILKYGWENVEHEIIFDKLSKEDAEKIEIELISKYQSNKSEFGYNTENGGCSVGKMSEKTKQKLKELCKGWHHSDDAKKIIGEKSIGRNSKLVRCIETNQIYCSQEDASEKIGISIGMISMACNGKRKTAGGFHWEFVNHEDINKREISNETREKMIAANKTKNNKKVICIETGIVYESMMQAEREIGISMKSISNCCRGKSKTAGGYHWEFVEEHTH